MVASYPRQPALPTQVVKRSCQAAPESMKGSPAAASWSSHYDVLGVYNGQ
jgi:hypothetical protein